MRKWCLVNGQTTAYAYDVVNRTATTTLPGDRVIVQESYPTGELKRISGADTYTQEWTYNPVWGGKATLTTWKDSGTPQVTSWTYNNRGFNTAKQYADGNGPTYTYNADGQILTRTWARGITTTYTYDNAGRITEQSYSDGTPALSYALNMFDQLTTVTDAAGTWNFGYNTAQQLVSATNPVILNSVTNYTYDALARSTVIELMQGATTHATVSYGYDPLSRIAMLGNGSDTLSYAYRPGMTQLQTAQWRNAQDEVLNGRSYEYDTRHRLTEIKLDGVREVAYTLNDKDQRVETTLTNGDNWTYAYDTLGQLTGALKKDSQNNTLNSMSYAFDQIGNRITAAEDSTNWTYASNLLNQYTTINAMQPTYDADGNMLTWNGWAYTWNGENRLVAAENSDTRVEMNYDFMGRRFEKKMYRNNIQLVKHEKYVYDGYKQIALYDAQNEDALLTTYTWQPVALDVPVSMTRDGETFYFVTDGNKNVTALLDVDGNRVAEYTYGPFGQTMEATGSMTENPFRFSSEFHDEELSLVYYNYRYYNPTLGRWIKQDQIEEEGGVNLYGYIQNNSVNLLDHLGEKVEIEQVLIAEFGYFHVYDVPRISWWPWGEHVYVGSLRYPLIGPTASIDEIAAKYFAYRVLGYNTTVNDISNALGAGIVICEVAIRLVNVPLDFLLSLNEFLEEPSVLTAAGMLPFIPAGAAKVLKKMSHPKFGKFYKDPKTGHWWSKDTAGHGGSHYKVYKQHGKQLEWLYDADELGKAIISKHKGDVGMYIPLKQFRNK